MIDDQDRCEWVNVYSGTGSPGYSQTEGHKAVVVVLMLKILLNLNGITATGH